MAVSDLLISIAGNVLLFALVFGMSATVDVTSLMSQMRNVKAILTGILCQFVIIPLLGFMVVKTMDLSHATGITLLVVTSSPGGSYSNWWCSLFNADLALSVTMTAISTILSIFMLPLNLLVFANLSYHEDILSNLDWTALFTALIIVICAIGLGLSMSAKIDNYHFQKFANQLGNIAGLLLIIFSATMTNTGDSDTKIWSRDWSFYVGTALPCVGGLFLATLLSTFLSLKRPERITVAVEACYQNVGIATSVALSMFDGNDLNDAMGVPFFYGVVEAVLVGAYCIIAWKLSWTKAPASTPFWQMIITSYEVLEYEEKEVSQIEVDISRSDTDVERQDGSILFTYFDLSWLSPEPENNNHAASKTPPTTPTTTAESPPPNATPPKQPHPFFRLGTGCV